MLFVDPSNVYLIFLIKKKEEKKKLCDLILLTI